MCNYYCSKKKKKRSKFETEESMGLFDRTFQASIFSF